EIRVAMVGPPETMIDPNLVVAAVVLVVTHEDVQFLVQRDVVDVAKSGCENVEVTPVTPATENAAALHHQQISLGPSNLATVVAQGEVKPAVMAGRHSIGTMQPPRVALRRQPQPAEQVSPLFSHTVPIVIAQCREQGRVHHKGGAVMKGQSLDRVQPAGVNRR